MEGLCAISSSLPGMLRVSMPPTIAAWESQSRSVAATQPDESRPPHYRSDGVRAVQAKHSRNDRAPVSKVTQNLPSFVTSSIACDRSRRRRHSRFFATLHDHLQRFRCLFRDYRAHAGTNDRRFFRRDAFERIAKIFFVVHRDRSDADNLRVSSGGGVESSAQTRFEDRQFDRPLREKRAARSR